MIAALALALAVQLPQGPYADSATAALVARARLRHHALSADVRGYQATVTTKLDVSAARGRFARLLPLAVVEQVATVWWQAPNDLRLVTQGQRFRTAFRDAQMTARWNRPWFIPRFLGDSIRLLNEDFPNRAAVHPLREGAEAYYRYAIEDSLAMALPGRTVRAVAVRVTPTRAEAALVAGQMWLDAETAEMVRFRFTFVGRDLWSRPELGSVRDSAAERREADLAGRVLRVSADLEYGLFEQRYWLPFRQSVLLQIELPWFGGVVVPVDFVSTFTGMRVNGGAPIAFSVPLPDTGAVAKVEEGERGITISKREPTTAERRQRRRQREEAWHRADSTRRREGYTSAGRLPGGRYEILVPPDSALNAYAGWTDSLDLGLTPSDAARLDDLRRETLSAVGALPPGFAGPRPPVLSIDRLGDLFRYNRAEGTTFGAGLSVPVAGPFLTVAARARYAFTDRRLQAAVALRRDLVGVRTEIGVFREMSDADPLAPGLSPGNSIRAMFLARDDGSYVFAQGVELRREFAYRNAADVSLGLRFVQERAPNRVAHSGLNDLLGGTGEFRPLEPVLPGTFTALSASIAGGVFPGSWRVSVEGVSGAGRAVARTWASAATSLRMSAGVDVAVSGWVGASAGDSIPQRQFRLGGMRTLRGYDAGQFRGAGAYAASLDVSLGQGLLRPFMFTDVGQAAPRGLAFAGGPKASVGAGLSALGGLVRVYGARPLEAGARWRVDVAFGSFR